MTRPISSTLGTPWYVRCLRVFLVGGERYWCSLPKGHSGHCWSLSA